MGTRKTRRNALGRGEPISSVDTSPLGTREHITAIRKIKRAENYALENYAEVIRAATERAKEGSAKHTELLEKYVVEPHKEEAKERIRQRSERPKDVPAIIRMAIAQLPVAGSGQQAATMAVAELRRDIPRAQGFAEAGQLAAENESDPESYVLEPGEKLCEHCRQPYKPIRPHIQRFCFICGDENGRQKARERKARFLARHASTL
jgi:hypothetical protein